MPAFAACLADLEVGSLAEFGESVDLEEGHDKQMRAVLDALPNKPKKAKGLKNRCIRRLNELITALVIFDEADQDEDTLLSAEEVQAIPVDKAAAKSGAALSAVFEAADLDADGFWNLSLIHI